MCYWGEKMGKQTLPSRNLRRQHTLKLSCTYLSHHQSHHCIIPLSFCNEVNTFPFQANVFDVGWILNRSWEFPVIWISSCSSQEHDWEHVHGAQPNPTLFLYSDTKPFGISLALKNLISWGPIWHVGLTQTSRTLGAGLLECILLTDSTLTSDGEPVAAVFKIMLQQKQLTMWGGQIVKNTTRSKLSLSFGQRMKLLSCENNPVQYRVKIKSHMF